MATRTLKQPRIHKPRTTHCEECGRELPKQSWRAICATCRKPPEKRRHMRDIYREQGDWLSRARQAKAS